jgi:hypothetical protein
MNCPICNAIFVVGHLQLKDGCCCKDIQCGICKTIFRLEFKVLKETELTKEQISAKFKGGHNISTMHTYDEQQHVVEYPVKKGK